MKALGFTGTQVGMNEAQLEAVWNELRHYKATGYRAFHHGDCIGADMEAATLANVLGYKIVCHPPDNPAKRGYFWGNDEILDEFPYLVRNQHIVRDSAFVIATPKEQKEIDRSGTWATIRQARSRTEAHVITPDGLLEVQDKSYAFGRARKVG
jgi:hypothetical protein